MKTLITTGSLLVLAGVLLGQLHAVGSTVAMIVMVAGAALMLAGVIKRRTRPGDFNRSGWTGA